VTNEEYVALLNTLLEAERAGARLLSDYVNELPEGSDLRSLLIPVQRDEAENCAVLIRLLREAGAEPSKATGSFYEKGLAKKDWRERLAFLNKGQAWVQRRLEETVPDLPAGTRELGEMLDSHAANIALCDERLKRL
jgi:nitronate monooxygenase